MTIVKNIINHWKMKIIHRIISAIIGLVSYDLSFEYYYKFVAPDEDPVNDYLKSEEFQKDFARRVEEDTWGKGLPKIYMDKEGRIVEHWKDGTINILKENVE